MPHHVVPEYIACAAIHVEDNEQHVHQPTNINTGYVICGHRHHNCLATNQLIREKLRAEGVHLLITQGFLTSSNRFVGRVEAGEIAFNAGQVLWEKSDGKPLISEDLY